VSDIVHRTLSSGQIPEYDNALEMATRNGRTEGRAAVVAECSLFIARVYLTNRGQSRKRASFKDKSQFPAGRRQGGAANISRKGVGPSKSRKTRFAHGACDTDAVTTAFIRIDKMKIPRAG